MLAGPMLVARLAAFAALAALLSGCGRADSTITSTPPPSASTVAPQSIDAVMRRAHFAFHAPAAGAAVRPHGTPAAFVGGGDSYDVAVHGDGSIALTRQAHASETLTLATDRPVVGAPVRGDDGSVTIAHPDCVEHLSNGPSGLEQSWTFAEAPSGSADGDLHLSISTSGMRYDTTTAGGVHFRGPTARFRYGAATWVDARGRRTAVRTHADGGKLTFTSRVRCWRRPRFPPRSIRWSDRRTMSTCR